MSSSQAKHSGWGGHLRPYPSWTFSSQETGSVTVFLMEGDGAQMVLSLRKIQFLIKLGEVNY